MQLVDLTDAYRAAILGKRGLKEYCRSYPALFKHYFKFWARKRYWHAALPTPSAVQRQRNLILSRLPIIEKKLTKAGFDILQLKLVLFVGQNTSNGHAFLDKEKFVVWIPIEAYTSKLQVDVFVTHEILHSLHYERRPEFYFTTERQRRSVSRQFVTEGLASWASAHILDLAPGIALWADYLSFRERMRWLTSCRRRESELKLYLTRNFSTTAKAIQLFYANDPKNIFAYRAGYWAGFRAVVQIAQRHRYGITELINLTRQQFEQLVKNEFLMKK